MNITAITSMSQLSRIPRQVLRGIWLLRHGHHRDRQRRAQPGSVSSRISADDVSEQPPVDHAALLHEVRAALASVSQERAALTSRAQELQREFQLVDGYSRELSEARSEIEERLNLIFATEDKLNAAEERLQQFLLAPPPQPEFADPIVNLQQEQSAALVEGDGIRRPPSKPQDARLSGGWRPRMAVIVVTVCSIALGVLLFGSVLDGPSTVASGVPTIERVTLDPAQPMVGEPVTIRWDIANADIIEIQPLLNDLDSDLSEYTFADGFGQDTTLMFVATNEHGRVERPVVITLDERIDTPAPAPTQSADVALDSSSATASEPADPSPEPTPSSDPQVTSTPSAPSPPRTGLSDSIPSPEPAPPVQTYTPTTPEPTPTPVPPSPTAVPPTPLPPTPIPTATPVEVDASPTLAAPTTTDASSCSPTGTLPSGAYCNETGLFAVWVYACVALELSVDWGDGVIELYEGLQIGESVSHQYSVPGTYAVVVSSTFDVASCQQAETAVTYTFVYPSSS